MIRSSLTNARSAHQVHTPLIELTEPMGLAAHR
jgi:hypothetical protein